MTFPAQFLGITPRSAGGRCRWRVRGIVPSFYRRGSAMLGKRGLITKHKTGQTMQLHTGRGLVCGHYEDFRRSTAGIGQHGMGKGSYYLRLLSKTPAFAALLVPGSGLTSTDGLVRRCALLYRQPTGPCRPGCLSRPC